MGPLGPRGRLAPDVFGRSRGGRTTKLHALVDGLGRPVVMAITPGQRGDAPMAIALIRQDPSSHILAADAAYASSVLRMFLLKRGTMLGIPNNPTRRWPQPFTTPSTGSAASRG